MSRLELKTILISILPSLEHNGGTGEYAAFPKFDLMPTDYLGYAEQELAVGSVASRINCVAHLKRAVDCELDTFFHVLGLYPLLQKRNLRFEKKTELIRAMGIVSPRSLAKINQIRNKLEHEYSLPDPSSLDLYFDLCSAFVSMVEGYIFMFCSNAHMDWCSRGKAECNLVVQYKSKSTVVSFQTWDGSSERTFKFTPDSLEDFAWAMRIYFQLCRATSLIAVERISEELKEEIA